MNSRRVFVIVSFVVALGPLGWIACGGSVGNSATADAGAEGTLGSVDANIESDSASGLSRSSGGRSSGSAGDGGSRSGSSGGSSSGSSRGEVTGTPACVFEGGAPNLFAVPAFGSFTGPDLSGDICTGGAFAYLERTEGSATTSNPILFVIDPPEGNPANFIHFQAPASATGGDLTFLAGVSTAAPSTHLSTGACGGVSFCVFLPVPSSVDCGDASASTTCPPGCEFTGPHAPPISAPTCTPTRPENCYVAQGTSDCMGGMLTPEGSWNVTLTSVVPYEGRDGATGIDYVVHGTFAATMMGQDAGLGAASLSVNF
jgi:hypothetical protein